MRRRKAREAILQILYGLDEPCQKDTVPEQALADYFANYADADRVDKAFLERVFRGIFEERSKIDQYIEKYSQHWKIDRINIVDRNVLRIAIFEMMHFADTPKSVIINEAISVGKRYGTDESGAFINGILDQIAKEFVKS